MCECKHHALIFVFSPSVLSLVLMCHARMKHLSGKTMLWLEPISTTSSDSWLLFSEKTHHTYLWAVGDKKHARNTQESRMRRAPKIFMSWMAYQSVLSRLLNNSRYHAQLMDQVGTEGLTLEGWCLCLKKDRVRPTWEFCRKLILYIRNYFSWHFRREEYLGWINVVTNSHITKNIHER